MKNIFLVIPLVLFLTACNKEHNPEDASILDYTVTDLNQVSFTPDCVFTDEENKTIYLLFMQSFSSASFPLQFTGTFSLTDGATCIPASGETIAFNNKEERFQYAVTASDGTQINYYIVLRDNQLPNADFEEWYSTKGMDGAFFNEPGKSAETTVWATANQGTSTFGIYCTTPVITDGNTVVKIVTGETSLVPVTAGTIFTGKFDINGAINHPTDPKQATKFGIPYTLRPVSIKFMYTYHPGSRYVHAELNNPNNIFGGFTVTDIQGNDMFTAYAVLEKRDGNTTVPIARAELISGDVQNVLKEIVLPFTYSSTEKPTHIYVVFSSSKDGDLFTGAVGSTLTIDDVELIY